MRSFSPRPLQALRNHSRIFRKPFLHISKIIQSESYKQIRFARYTARKAAPAMRKTNKLLIKQSAFPSYAFQKAQESQQASNGVICFCRFPFTPFRKRRKFFAGCTGSCEDEWGRVHWSTQPSTAEAVPQQCGKLTSFSRPSSHL